MSSAALAMVDGGAAPWWVAAGAASPAGAVGPADAAFARAPRQVPRDPDTRASTPDKSPQATAVYGNRGESGRPGAAATTLFLAQSLGQAMAEAPVGVGQAAAAYGARAASVQEPVPALDIVLPTGLPAWGRALDLSV